MTSTAIRRIAYQGEPGAYSDLAIREHFGTAVEGVPFRTFPDVLRATAAHECDCAIVPVENAIAGPVRVALDAMRPFEETLVETDEYRLAIELCLLGVPGAMLATVRTVRSHPVALAQCRILRRAIRGSRSSGTTTPPARRVRSPRRATAPWRPSRA